MKRCPDTSPTITRASRPAFPPVHVPVHACACECVLVRACACLRVCACVLARVCVLAHGCVRACVLAFLRACVLARDLI